MCKLYRNVKLYTSSAAIKKESGHKFSRGLHQLPLNAFTRKAPPGKPNIIQIPT